MTTFHPHPLATQALVSLPMRDVKLLNPEGEICMNCSLKVVDNLLVVMLDMGYFGIELWAVDWTVGRTLMVIHLTAQIYTQTLRTFCSISLTCTLETTHQCVRSRCWTKTTWQSRYLVWNTTPSSHSSTAISFLLLVQFGLKKHYPWQ